MPTPATAPTAKGTAPATTVSFTDENGSVAAYITTGAARPIRYESPARTARCVASEEAMSSPIFQHPNRIIQLAAREKRKWGYAPKQRYMVRFICVIRREA